MSRTIRIGRLHRAGPAAQRTQRPQGRSRTHRRAVLAASTALLTATAGCTAQPAEQSGTEWAPTTTEAVPLLEDQPDNAPLPPGRYVVSPFDAPSSASGGSVALGERENRGQVASTIEEYERRRAEIERTPLAPVLQVPEGYTAFDEGSGVAANDVASGDVGVVWVWDIEAVYTHPCDGGRPETVGPSVADLANALAAQPLRDGTDPVPVTVGGYDGLYVELSVPDDIDIDSCDLGKFNSWPGRWQQGPGQVDRLWIVDVEGQRITFDVAATAGVTPETVNGLKELVTTATFTRPEGT